VATRGRPPRRHLPGPLAFLILLALLFGAVAALLAAPVSNTPPPPAPSPRNAPGPLPGWVPPVVVGLFLVFVGALVYARFTGGMLPGVQRLAAVVLVIVLLGLVFLVLVHYATGGTSYSTTNGSLNSSGMGQPPTGGAKNNTTPTSFPPLQVGHWLVPAWVIYAAVVGAVVVALAVAVPLWRAMRAEREDEEGPGGAEKARVAQQAVIDALAQLESDPNADPREVVLALYARLLDELEPHLPSLSERTAREIERAGVRELGFGPAHARELRTLFEEARYSTHPVDRSMADRARAALRALRADLDEQIRRRGERVSRIAPAPDPLSPSSGGPRG
jgi:TRAP-type C4-dicarboxylate transport system permease small subunit